MAAIDPDSTQKVTPAVALAAANGAGKRKPRPEADPGPSPHVPEPVGLEFDPVKPPAAPLTEEQLTRVMQMLGYGAGNQGPALIAHDADEGSLIEFVDTGVIRFPTPLPAKPDTPRVYRLRPPLFGEHKTMRLALADALERVDYAKLDYQAATNEANRAKDAARQLDEPDASKAMIEAKRVQRAADEVFEDMVADLMQEWWGLVFETVGLDGTPDDWGTWAGDTDLAVRVIQHWRTSPTAPGR